MNDGLKQALETLEIKGTIVTKQRDRWTVDVYVDSEWFGLWDTEKNTFVE
jgi:hypothetical protein